MFHQYSSQSKIRNKYVLGDDKKDSRLDSEKRRRREHWNEMNKTCMKRKTIG